MAKHYFKLERGEFDYTFQFVKFGSFTWRVAVFYEKDGKREALTDVYSLNKCISFSSPPASHQRFVQCGRFFLISEFRFQGHGRRIGKCLLDIYASFGCEYISVTPSNSSLARHFWCNIMGFRPSLFSTHYYKNLAC